MVLLSPPHPAHRRAPAASPVDERASPTWTANRAKRVFAPLLFPAITAVAVAQYRRLKSIIKPARSLGLGTSPERISWMTNDSDGDAICHAPPVACPARAEPSRRY